VAPDLRGMGLSSRPEGGYDKKTQGRDVVGMPDALGIQRADLITHDIGNMVGYAFAAQYQDRVARFVLMDALLPGVGPWDEILKTGHGGPRQKSQTFQSLKSAIDEDRCLGMREHLKRLAT
jgi:pimeloyl-ACP methyl ester carboxylesterase